MARERPSPYQGRMKGGATQNIILVSFEALQVCKSAESALLTIFIAGNVKPAPPNGGVPYPAREKGFSGGKSPAKTTRACTLTAIKGVLQRAAPARSRGTGRKEGCSGTVVDWAWSAGSNAKRFTLPNKSNLQGWPPDHRGRTAPSSGGTADGRTNAATYRCVHCARARVCCLCLCVGQSQALCQGMDDRSAAEGYRDIGPRHRLTKPDL